ncbi:MAG TPA: methyltransferase domain-containing protein [Actinomycetota bacterium]|nr:methyltransferase domain-containing protein [Actinomycetota bacterium]
MARIEPGELARRLRDGWEPVLVDVRTTAEHRRGRIAGSYHVPLPRAMRRGIDGAGRPVVLVCQHGPRAVAASRRTAGEAWVLRGGFSAWRRAGLPVEGGRTASMLDASCAVLDRLGFEDWRRWAAGSARGRTLEVGAGTARNMRHYPPGVRPILLDPDIDGLRYARGSGRASRAGLVCAEAEALPFRDAALDTLVSTLVLCSVRDPQRAAGEMRRVLADGGRLVGVEHVLPKSRVASGILRRLDPLWSRATQGCHLDRTTIATLRGAGWDVRERRRAMGGFLRSFTAT